MQFRLSLLSSSSSRRYFCVACDIESIGRWSISGDLTSVFEDEYIIYHKEDAVFADANETCNGGLVTLKTEEKKEFLTDIAGRHGISGNSLSCTDQYDC